MYSLEFFFERLRHTNTVFYKSVDRKSNTIDVLPSFEPI
jgi:hypothetical protein